MYGTSVSLFLKGLSENTVRINEVSIEVFCINNEDIRCLMNDGHDSFSCPQKFSPGSPALRGELQCIVTRVGNWSLLGFPAPKNIHSFAYMRQSFCSSHDTDLRPSKIAYLRNTNLYFKQLFGSKQRLNAY